MKLKKTVKIILGVIIFFTLPSLLFFGFTYYKYNQELPVGIQGEQADALAHKMLLALDHKAYEETNYIEWTFKGRHRYKWQKDEQTCVVMFEDYKINLDLNNYVNSKVFVHSFEIQGDKAQEIIQQAVDYFNNDSFWLVAPYKVFDKNVERSLVKLETGDYGLLVTYKSGGTTPGDSYLWILENSGKPKAYRMWTSILPIDGLEASWTDWITTQSGAQLPTFHKLLFLGLDMGEVKGTK